MTAYLERYNYEPLKEGVRPSYSVRTENVVRRASGHVLGDHGIIAFKQIPVEVIKNLKKSEFAVGGVAIVADGMTAGLGVGNEADMMPERQDPIEDYRPEDDAVSYWTSGVPKYNEKQIVNPAQTAAVLATKTIVNHLLGRIIDTNAFESAIMGGIQAAQEAIYEYVQTEGKNDWSLLNQVFSGKLVAFQTKFEAIVFDQKNRPVVAFGLGDGFTRVTIVRHNMPNAVYGTTAQYDTVERGYGIGALIRQDGECVPTFCGNNPVIQLICLDEEADPSEISFELTTDGKWNEDDDWVNIQGDIRIGQ